MQIQSDSQKLELNFLYLFTVWNIFLKLIKKNLLRFRLKWKKWQNQCTHNIKVIRNLSLSLQSFWQHPYILR